MQLVTVAGSGITLDLLLWREHGRAGQTDEILARALELNPGVAGLGAVLPLQTVVILPDPPTERPRRAVVDLFGSA